MPARRLTTTQGNRVFEIAVSLLRTANLPSPEVGQREASYTAHQLRPSVGAELDKRKIQGLRVSGDGGGPVRPVFLFGLQFFPDLTLAYFDQQIGAFEVKFLRERQRQHQLVTATGQAYFYRRVGYERVGIVLIDLNNRLSDTDIVQAEELSAVGPDAIELIIRRRLGRQLAPHP